MAKVNDNVMMRNNSGMVGGQVVYRNRKGKTVVSNAPKKRQPGSATEAQKVIQKDFGKAVRYAKKLKGNEAIKDIYAARTKGGQTAYNLALADAFKAPEVLDINTSAYTGLVQQVIIIEAVDNFQVKEVKVVITDGNNNEVENGNAVENQDDANWSYTTTKANPALAGTRFTVTATDMPGNSGVLEKNL